MNDTDRLDDPDLGLSPATVADLAAVGIHTWGDYVRAYGEPAMPASPRLPIAQAYEVIVGSPLILDTLRDLGPTDDEIRAGARVTQAPF